MSCIRGLYYNIGLGLKCKYAKITNNKNNSTQSTQNKRAKTQFWTKDWCWVFRRIGYFFAGQLWNPWQLAELLGSTELRLKITGLSTGDNNRQYSCSCYGANIAPYWRSQITHTLLCLTVAVMSLQWPHLLSQRSRSPPNSPPWNRERSTVQ